MLELFVTSKHGNASDRYFPHTGYLGVTPVVLAGSAVTKLPPFCAPLQVKAITLRVKCVEHRAGGAFEGDADHTLYEHSKPLFHPPDSQQYAEMGEWESHFKLSIPPEAIVEARSAMYIREYKVTWRMEVVIDHKPIPYVGSSISKAFALDLQNHRSPSLPPLSPPLPLVVGTDAYSTQVSLGTPHGSYGPGDTITVSVNARSSEHGTHIKKVIMVLERVIEFMDAKSETSLERRRQTPSPPSKISVLFRRSTSPRPPLQRIPSDPSVESSHDSRHSTVRDKIAEASCSDFDSSGPGAYRCSLSVSLPRRSGKWDIGETHRSKLVSMSYQLKVSMTIKTKSKSAAKTFTCPPIPISLVATSAEDRATAAASADTVHEKKRHRSSRRGLYMHEGNIDLTDAALRQHQHRHRHKASRSTSNSPILSPVSGAATDVKPILLPSGHPSQSQSISFIFPSRQDVSPHRPETRNSVQIPIQSLLHPTYSPEKSAPQLPSPPPTRAGGPDIDIWRRVQETGRRISTTTSEEEEVQPSRSRQKVRAAEDDRAAFPSSSISAASMAIPAFGSRPRPALPSLDALGLGLPYVPDTGRPRSRPRTAPVHSTFSMHAASSAAAAATAAAKGVPPPLSGFLTVPTAEVGARPITSMGMGRMTSGASNASISPDEERDTFAFTFTPSTDTLPPPPPPPPPAQTS